MMKEYLLKENGLCYRTNEFKEGRKTLVFIHGLSGSASAWKEYEKRFENDCNILTFDLRGHGKSNKPSQYEEYRIECFVRDLKALVDSLHIDSCVLIGHSLGAAIALDFVLTYPEIASTVIFLSPDFHTTSIKLSRYVYPFIAWCAGIVSRFPVMIREGKQVDYHKYKNTGDWNLRRMAADISNTGLRVYFYCLKQLYIFDREDKLKDIKIPTIVIHGENDTVVPYNIAQTMARNIPNSKFILLPKANHIVVINNAIEISNVIDEVIK